MLRSCLATGNTKMLIKNFDSAIVSLMVLFIFVMNIFCEGIFFYVFSLVKWHVCTKVFINNKIVRQERKVVMCHVRRVTVVFL